MQLLIDRVIVTDEDVEIRYAVSPSPGGPRYPLCHLRTDYLDGLSRESPAGVAPGAAVPNDG